MVLVAVKLNAVKILCLNNIQISDQLFDLRLTAEIAQWFSDLQKEVLPVNPQLAVFQLHTLSMYDAFSHTKNTPNAFAEVLQVNR